MIIIGENAKLCLGIVRHNGSGWIIQQDATHDSHNLEAISVGGSDDYLYLQHSFAGRKILNLFAIGDEAYARGGIQFGTEVGPSGSSIWAYSHRHISAQFDFNGSAWSIADQSSDVNYGADIASVAWSTNKLIVTFNAGYRFPDRACCLANCRNGTYIATVGAVTGNTAEILLFNYGGTQVTAPGAGTSICFLKSCQGYIRPSQLASANYTGSNIWINGTFFS